MIVSLIECLRSTPIAATVAQGFYGKGKTDVFMCGFIMNKVPPDH